MKLVIAASFLPLCSSFAPLMFGRPSLMQLDMAKVGVFFGTSTGSTESVADMIKDKFGDDAEGPFDIEALEGSVKDNFGKYDALVVGTPTWNTGADTERSGTGWDEIYYSALPELDLKGKKVAVFGLGDQISYCENYADATGELHDVFEGLGCKMMGYTSTEGYEHEASKSQRGDKFCGLLCDMVNQEDLSEGRVDKWVEQLKGEGFLEGGPATSSSSSEAAATSSAAAPAGESKVGIFFGTSTGSTESVADMIKEQCGGKAEGPFDIEALEGSVKENFEKYGSLIVGTPTWNTGADTERSGTGWDEIYYSTLPELDLKGKKVAVFGLGDQISYCENYADATGELHDVFEGLGCKMMGYTSTEGYEHEASKSQRGDKFCGLLCDMVNQEDLSEGRVNNWVAQLTDEGFFEGGAVSAASSAAPTIVDAQTVETVVTKVAAAAPAASSSGYTAFHNPSTKSTMWVSADGRSCYYTSD
eukprot:Nitzschia sp. Nitz4//scaffold3_size479765//91933//93357//NITZ4_000035-RA/size479765-processed-gene-0.90-mRNA-1//-1//CDS//3329550563//1569//frame0